MGPPGVTLSSPLIQRLLLPIHHSKQENLTEAEMHQRGQRGAKPGEILLQRKFSCPGKFSCTSPLSSGAASPDPCPASCSSLPVPGVSQTGKQVSRAGARLEQG